MPQRGSSTCIYSCSSSRAKCTCLTIHLQPVPRRLKNIKIGKVDSAKNRQPGQKPCQLGKPLKFKLILNDDHGTLIAEPSRWFRLHNVTVHCSSGQQLACRSVSGDAWLHTVDIPASGMAVGPQELQFTGEFEPLHWELQQYLSCNHIQLDIRSKVEVSAGAAASLRLQAAPEAFELSLLPLRLEALDALGNITTDFGKDMAFIARIEQAEARLDHDSSCPGRWSGNLCMAVAPGDHSITIRPSNSRLAAGLQLPQPHHIRVTRLPFVSSISLELSASARITAGAAIIAQVSVSIASGAQGATLSTKRARDSLKVRINDGTNAHELAFCSDNTPGLQFRYAGHVPLVAGAAHLEATWTEERQKLVEALQYAEEAGQANLEALSWQTSSSSIQLDIQPGAMHALQLYLADPDAADLEDIGIALGQHLPQLCARVVDVHGNQVNLGSPPPVCSMHAQIVLDADFENLGLRPPVLASRQPSFQALWSEADLAFHIASEATSLAHAQLGNSQAVKALYQVHVDDQGPLQGFAGTLPFTYSDLRSHVEEQASARKIVDELSPEETSHKKVKCLISCIMQTRESTAKSCSTVLLLQDTPI